MLREGVEYVSVLINPVEHGRRRQSQLANPVLTESIFPGLISRRRNYSVKMRMHKRSHHPKLHTNSLPVPTHSHHPKRHTSSLPVPTHFGAMRTPPVDSSTLRSLECIPGANAPVEATGGHLSQA